MTMERNQHSERLREIRVYLAEDAAIDDMPRAHPSSPTPMLRDLLAAYDGLEEQFETASDLLRRLREWDIIAGPGTPEGEFTADAPYWRSELDRVLSIPASEPEQEAK